MGTTIMLEMTEYMIEQMKDVFDLEVELMQAEHQVLPNGMHRYKFEISGYKLDMFRDFERMMIAQAGKGVNVQYFGSTINPN